MEKISLIVYTLFHNNSIKDKISSKMTVLKIGNKITEITLSIKFLTVMFDEHLSWKDLIKTVENKLAKNLGLLYHMKQFLDENSLKAMYFSCIDYYLNYANIAWESTHCTKLKAISYKKKQAACTIFDEDRFCHSRPLLENLKSLNVYEINLFQHLSLMHGFKIGDLLKNFKNT